MICESYDEGNVKRRMTYLNIQNKKQFSTNDLTHTVEHG